MENMENMTRIGMPSSVTSNCRESRFKSSETVRDDKWPTNVEKWFEFTPL